MDLSVVIPIFNERENVRLLHARLHGVLTATAREFEILFVDDGSTDGSGRELASLAAIDPQTRVIELRGNFGQTAALAAGIEHAAGDVIVTLDGDLQNDPADIPMMIERLECGHDLVHGWRKDRHDALLSRRLPSRIANWLIARVTGVRIHDLGCTLKVMRRDVALELPLHGQMHRFIPILAQARGARCCEVVVQHHPRRFGQTKYGLSRTLRVLFDLLAVHFFVKYLASPMKLFGCVGLLCACAGMCSLGAALWTSMSGDAGLLGNPLLTLGGIAMLFAVQFLGFGLLGELGARIYFGARHRRPYTVRRTLNFDEPIIEPYRSSVTSRAA